MAKIIIFGYTDFSRLIGRYIQIEGDNEFLGYCVDHKYMNEQMYAGGVLTFEDLGEIFPQRDVQIILTVGYTNMNRNRLAVARHIKEEGYLLASFVSRKALLAADEVGEGNVVMPGAVIEPGSRLGSCNIIQPNSVVSHDDFIGDGCFLAPASVLAGSVTLGDGCFIGANATVRNGVTLGHHVLVGAGAYVSHDLPDEAVFVPAQGALLPKESSSIRI